MFPSSDGVSFLNSCWENLPKIAEQNGENMLAQSSIGDASVFCGMETFTNSGEKDFVTIPEIRDLSKESY